MVVRLEKFLRVLGGCIRSWVQGDPEWVICRMPSKDVPTEEEAALSSPYH